MRVTVKLSSGHTCSLYRVSAEICFEPFPDPAEICFDPFMDLL